MNKNILVKEYLNMNKTSGLLNINKPPEMTSYAAVEVIKQETGLKRVGHGGTLDPLAVGVLIICLDKATRLAEYIRKQKRTYNANLKLGFISNTYDRCGIKKKIKIKKKPTLAEVKKVLKGFLGLQEQSFPPFMAIKEEKKYKYIKQTKKKSQKIYIYDIKLLEYNYPYLKIKIACSAGTSIASLAHQIGKELKSGAYLASLLRTRVGDFVIKDSIPLREINKENWTKLLIPSYLAVQSFPQVILDSVQIDQLKRGLAVSWKHPFSKKEREKDIVCLTKEKEVAAIAQYDPDTEELLPKKVLV